VGLIVKINIIWTAESEMETVKAKGLKKNESRTNKEKILYCARRTTVTRI
jgi:hypothetical protein